MSEEPKQVTFVYEKSEGKKTIAATGAIGGPTPDGRSVVSHFFVEHAAIPNYTTHDIGEGGRIDLSKGDTVKRGDATREIQVTLITSPEEAINIGKWLVEKGEQALNQRNGNQSPNG